ncbi:AlwI family type II restriction endonuclease [Lysinibacillus sp. NPDC097279]|uniref:AlwI family type II restriction endonuclease n=1 Tax=Lysinibacillus sp. NPDC097279 TaxID=3364143 RepID=UPI00380342C6
MINNWVIPRNKRILNPANEILALYNWLVVGQIWNGDTNLQLEFEDALERFKLKNPGNRRDRRAGGARTYESWLLNLGLIFKETDTNIQRLTLSGEQLLNGTQLPGHLLTHQLLKLQYPSVYSKRARVQIHPRFNIRPFRFLLRLLNDTRIQSLNKREIGRFVLTEAENESVDCFEHVIQRILDYRAHGDTILPSNFPQLYPSSTSGIRTIEKTIEALEDNANVFITYLGITQFILQTSFKRLTYISLDPAHISEVQAILNDGSTLRILDTTNSYGSENFQRNYGLGIDQTRDNRSFRQQTLTSTKYRENRIRAEFTHLSMNQPISQVTPQIVNTISSATGYSHSQVTDVLQRIPLNSLNVFEQNYLNMARSGTSLATEFERTTVAIFEEFEFNSQHVGPQPLHPDIYVENGRFRGIIDTKAYHAYPLHNNNKNTMINNYIPTYHSVTRPLNFYMYVANGFGPNVQTQMQDITNKTGVPGVAITAQALLSLLREFQAGNKTLNDLETMFTSNTVISII